MAGREIPELLNKLSFLGRLIYIYIREKGSLSGDYSHLASISSKFKHHPVVFLAGNDR